MKKAFQLSVAEPCQEKWEQFTPTHKGAFCAVCQKEVMDFTSKTETEISAYFANNAGAHTCGKFRKEQLKQYRVGHQLSAQPMNWWKASLLGAWVMMLGHEGAAQTVITAETEVVQSENTQKDISKTDSPTLTERQHIVSGVVKDEYGTPIAGVNIVLKGSDVGTITDIDGRFEFPSQVEEGDVLVFYFIGMITQEYEITSKAADIEIDMEMEMWQELMGEVMIDEVYPKPSLWSRIWNKATAIFK